MTFTEDASKDGISTTVPGLIHTNPVIREKMIEKCARDLFCLGIHGTEHHAFTRLAVQDNRSFRRCQYERNNCEIFLPFYDDCCGRVRNSMLKGTGEFVG